jgi:hypothetical protein
MHACMVVTLPSGRSSSVRPRPGRDEREKTGRLPPTFDRSNNLCAVACCDFLS